MIMKKKLFFLMAFAAIVLLGSCERDTTCRIHGKVGLERLNGKRIFLFEIESSLDENDPISEWEISAFKNDRGGHDIVGQIILDPDRAEPTPELVDYICRKYNLDAVKFYNEFEIGEITAKRDYILLTHDYNGYYAPCSKNHMMLINYSENGDTVKIRVRKDHKIEI